MNLYRPTTLNMASKHCVRSVDFMQAGTPYDRRLFEAGVSAHAILQALGEATKLRGDLALEDQEAIADATCRALIEFGRVEEDLREPPLSADMVFEGRELALNYAANAPLSPTAHYELGLAVDADWNPVPFSDPTARLRCILDVLDKDEEADEESSSRVLLVKDYKSAWPTDESELTTVQRKSQVCVAIAHFGAEYDVIRPEVVNLRTGKTFARPIYLEHEPHVIEQWRRDLTSLMDALDAQGARGRRPASPGAGCMGCPFLSVCDDAQNYIEDTRIPGTAERRAIAYAVAVSQMVRLKEMLQADTANGPVEIPRGVVGTVGKLQRVLKPEAYGALADEFSLAAREQAEIVSPVLRGFAKGSRLSVGNAEELCKLLFPGKSDRAERERFLNEITTTEVVRRFGIHDATAKKEESNAA